MDSHGLGTAEEIEDEDSDDDGGDGDGDGLGPGVFSPRNSLTIATFAPSSTHAIVSSIVHPFLISFLTSFLSS